jgi:hypothetical protein
MVEATQHHAANAALTRFQATRTPTNTHILRGAHAEDGAPIVAVVGRELEARYGRAFGERSLRRMVRFTPVFPDRPIVAALRQGTFGTYAKRRSKPTARCPVAEHVAPRSSDRLT